MSESRHSNSVAAAATSGSSALPGPGGYVGGRARAGIGLLPTGDTCMTGALVITGGAIIHESKKTLLIRIRSIIDVRLLRS